MQHQWQNTNPLTVAPRPRDARAIDTDALCEIARAVASAEPCWRGLVRHDPGQRWFTRLAAGVALEVWLLTWTTEQGVALHDHGGSSGVVLVVEGELTEDFADLRAPAAVQRVTRPAGRLHTFGSSHVHDLRNTTAGVATSIHVYSPPLSAMTFYEHDAAGRLAPVRIEPVAPAESAMLPAF